MPQRLKVIIIIFLFTKDLSGQNKIQIRIFDYYSKDFISDVNIYVNDTLIGSTNQYGYINKVVNSDFGIIRVSHISYYDTIFNLSDLTTGVNKVGIYPRINEFEKFTKKSSKNFTKNFGELSIPSTYFKKIPYIFGELDALKAIQTFPGISSSFEANSGVYVRGGNIDQTAIYLDGAPVYNIGHFYGFFSPFDGEALKNFTFYNSGIYAGFGSRGSSILDVKFREGNMSEHGGLISCGFITSKALVEGPVIKNKLSYLGSVRFSYTGAFINLKLNNNFIDGNIKIKYVCNSRNTFYFSSFLSNDVFSMDELNEFTLGNSSIKKMVWGNKTSTLRWDKVSKKGFAVHSTASLSKFNSRAFFNDANEPDFGNELQNYSVNIEFDNFDRIWKDFKFGLTFNKYVSSPAILFFNRANVPYFKLNILPVNHALETIIFAQNILNLNKRNISLISNLRAGFYKNQNDGYLDLVFEPRIKLVKKYKTCTLYAAFDKSSQYQSYVGNRQVAIPSDFWIQASNQFKAQKIFAYSIGLNREVKKYRVSSELFFKDYINALDVKNGANLFRNKDVLGEILNVKAIAFGSEFLLEKHSGKIQGHLSYTLSRSIRRSPEINSNSWFASNFDRTHIFNFAANYKPNEKWAWGFLGILQSGTPVTANFAYTFLYSLRNEYRLPIYYRVDFTVMKKFKIRKKLDCEWNISVFNVTFAKNRTSQYPATGSFGSLPSIPSFSLKIYFN